MRLYPRTPFKLTQYPSKRDQKFHNRFLEFYSLQDYEKKNFLN